MRSLFVIFPLSTVILAAAFAGCAGESAQQQPADSEHAVTQDDLRLVESTQPVRSDSVVLWVNGLGCPQCASNIDLQLARLPGVKGVRVDLGGGKVDVGLSGDSRPSPHDFAEAVTDAGFTLVKIEGAR